MNYKQSNSERVVKNVGEGGDGVAERGAEEGRQRVSRLRPQRVQAGRPVQVQAGWTFITSSLTSLAHQRPYILT